MELRRRRLALFRSSLSRALGAGLLLATIVPVTQAVSLDKAGATAGAQCTAPAATSIGGSAFSATETLCRSHFDVGSVDSRTFTVNVSNTTGLRNGQVVRVSWTGAHPTGGVVSQQQLASAAQQEYPVVLMECRGVDSTAVPVSEQLSTQTCWTGSVAERRATSLGQFPPMWNLDAYNPSSEQGVAVNVPNPIPAACTAMPGFTQLPYEYWLPFVNTSGQSFSIGPQGCAGSPPEMLTGIENANLIPSDTTYANTAPDGTGTTKFTIVTSETNASLGCSQSVACSLVIVPIEGISCSSNPTVPSAPQYSCENPGDFAPGELNMGQNPYGPAQAVTGAFWWSQSNWQRRISVPLNFATPADACSVNSSAPVEFYGSELLVQATQQWNPYFCLNPKLFNVDDVQLSEPQAKDSVKQGFIEAAIEGSPPPVPSGQSSYFTTPTVQAPIGVTGFAIAYSIDNSDGTPYTQLKLDPRLLAKLMTESYYATNNIQTGESGIANNPQSVFDDPEFKALNPSFHLPGGVQPAPAATLFNILTRSDVIWSLTSYINDDPEARAWLNGSRDPWGMTVNPAYLGIQLPVNAWPLLDTNMSGPDYTTAANPSCYLALVSQSVKKDANGGTQVVETPIQPIRPLIDSPQDTLAKVAYNMEYAIAASQIVCNNSTINPNYVALGPEYLGSRFLIGVVSLPVADELDLSTAALQSYGGPQEIQTSDQSAFVAGRTFVSPRNADGSTNVAGLKAAAQMLTADPSVGSWTLPYGDFSSGANAKSAYPGTMVMSADIPTKGLPSMDAQNYGQYLLYAATIGQTVGSAVGDIPSGYLPMTSANGLGDEVAYTQAAAADVASQNGQIPSLIPPPSQVTPSTTTTPTTTKSTATSIPSPKPPSGSKGRSTNGSPTGSFSTGTGGTTTTMSPAIQPNGGASNGGGNSSNSSGTNGPASGGQPVALAGNTVGIAAGLGGLALPLAAIVAIVGGVICGGTMWRRRTPVQR